MVYMAKQEKLPVKIARGFVNLIPNSKLFHDLANIYIAKYNNFYNSDIYTNREYRWLNQAIVSLQTPVIFDVGANIGKWIEGVLKINPTAIIHAFEPTATTFEKLSQHAFSSAIHLNNIGLGDEKKSLILYDYGDDNSHNSLYPRHDKPYQTQITVELDTLTNYCHQHDIKHIDYLKIDTEGHDYHVLVGAKSLLEQEQVDMIQFEYGNNYIDARIFLKDIFDLIAPLNYAIYRILPNTLRLIPNYHETHERFIYSNYVILNKKIASRLL